MAELNFRIASAFDGEGFQAATEALKQNKQEINAAKTGLADLTTALSGVSPAAATGVTAVKNFAAAFTAGGIVGGVIQLAIKGVSEAIEYFSEKAKAAQEATEKWAGIVRDNLVGSLEETNSKFGETRDKLSEVKKDLEETVKLLNGDINAQVETDIHNLHIEKLQQITDDMDESARKMLEEQTKGKEAIIKATAEVEKATNAWEAANDVLHKYNEFKDTAIQAEKTAQEQYINVTNNCSGYLEERARLQARLQNLEENYAEGRLSLNEIEEARKSIGLQLKQLEEDHKDEVAALSDAEKALKEAHQNVSEAEKSYQSALDEQTSSFGDLKNAQLALKEAEMTAAQAMKDASEDLKEKVQSADIKDLFKDVSVSIDAGFSDKIVDLFKDVPDNVSDIKEESKETTKKVQDIRLNQNKYGAKGASMNVSIDNFQPGSLPTIKDIAEQRKKIEEAPKQIAEEANQKYGYPLELYLQKVAEKNGRLDEADVKPFKDVITGVKSLPTDVGAQVIKDAASKLMLKSGYQNFFSNVEKVKEWLENGKDADNNGTDVSNIENDVGDIKENLKKCLELT